MPGLVINITGDSSGYRRELDKAASATSKANAHFGKVGSHLAKIGKAALIAGAALGGAAAVGAVKAVRAASDLSEQLSKTSVVFGKAGADVHEWAGGLARDFGLSQRAALEAAGTYGNMLVPMGYGRAEAAKMSKQFVELAADMASFNNASPEETLDALRAGLAGETEPLRRFGVFLNDNRIKAQAAAMGFKLVKGQLEPMAKAAATAAIIMKDTKDTQGDFARTSDGLANQQRILRAELENSAATLGKALIPAAIALMGVANDVIPVLTRWGTALSEALGPKLVALVNFVSANFVPTVLALRDALVNTFQWFEDGGAKADFLASALGGIGTALVTGIALVKTMAVVTKAWAVATGILNVVMAANPIGVVVIAIAGLVAALIIAYRRSEEFRRIVDQAWSVIRTVTAAVVNFITNTAIPTFVRAWGTASRAVQAAVDFIRPFVEAIAQIVRGMVNVVVGIIRGDWGRAWQGLKTAAMGGWNLFKAWLGGLPALIGRLALAIGEAIIHGIADGFLGLLDWLKSKLESGLKSIVSSLSPFSPVEEGGAKYIGKPLAEGVLQGWVMGTRELPSKMSDTLRKAVEAAATAVSDARSTFEAAFSELSSYALQAFDVVNDTMTKTEKRLARMDAARAAKEMAAKIKEARAALREAQQEQAALSPAGFESSEEYAAAMQAANEKVKEAQKALDDALYEQRRAALEKKAALERKRQEEQTALERYHFEKRLEALQKAYATGKLSAEEFHQKVVKLFKQYEIPYKKGANSLGLALAAGLGDALASVERAARRLRDAIVQGLSNIRVVVKVDVETTKAPGRQHGGPVTRGLAYVVGERGPELFVPTASGTIVPNGAGSLRAVGGGEINIHFHGGTFLGGSREALALDLRDALVRAGLRNSGGMLKGLA